MTPIERILVGWFEASHYHVEHDGHEWFAWVGERMLPLTEIAVAIGLEINQQGNENMTMREAFEQWAKESRQFTDWSRDKTSETNPYHKPRVELAWQAWQAGAAWGHSR